MTVNEEKIEDVIADLRLWAIFADTPLSEESKDVAMKLAVRFDAALERERAGWGPEDRAIADAILQDSAERRVVDPQGGGVNRQSVSSN